VACHQFEFVEKVDVLERAAPGAVFLLNSPYGPDQVWGHLPREVQEVVLEKGLRLFVIDAYKVAKEAGMGGRINTVMQTCFFALSGVLPRDEAIARIKGAIEKTYGKRGGEVVKRNFAAVDATLAQLHAVKAPEAVTARQGRPPMVADAAPDFVKRVTAVMMAGKGDLLPVSAFPVDGTWPMGTARWEKRNLALDIPAWDAKVCIQCNQCALVCPHAAIRAKVYAPEGLAGAPATFKADDFRSVDMKGLKYTIQVAPEDCTGCTLCVQVCPAKDKSNPRHKAIDMVPQRPLREAERENYAFFLDLPEMDRTILPLNTVKNTQLLMPLFEYSGACSGCGETPYVKLVSQLYGDRAVIANATGCSSIYGGNLPTTPWSVNKEGRGPVWSNSLFEDNAEFGLGFRLTLDKQDEFAREMLAEHRAALGEMLVDELLGAEQSTEKGLSEQRARVTLLRTRLAQINESWAANLNSVADALVKRSVWIMGGDGWAYDIGYGGLDHVIASGRDVNILVLDTQVYSNTGGQASKATPRAAVAKFAAAGKPLRKKDLGLIAMSYGNVYVAQVAMGANDGQTVRAILEAEAYPGPSLVIAYSHCIQQGFDLANGLTQQRLAVESGAWPLFRFNPDNVADGKPLLTLDSKAPKIPLRDYVYNETRYSMLVRSDEARAERLLRQAQDDVNERWQQLERLAGVATPA
jgi:pyruvate-ferredoxin/flavodoxin oxidoreductase